MDMIYKSNTLKIKDISSNDRIVQFYIVRFNSADQHGDIFTPGSLIFDFNLVKHFKNHDINMPVGVIKEIAQDDTGYYVTSKLLNTQIGNDTLVEYIEGAINQHSIGGYYEDGYYDGENYIINKFRLYEVSSLTHWAAQKDTPVISIKSKINIKELYETYLNIYRHGTRRFFN